MKKRVLSLLLALMMLLALTACQKEKEPEKEPTDPNDYHAALVDRTGKEGMFSAYYICTWEQMGSDNSSDYVYAGDSTLYISPDGKTMLVDASNAASGDEVMAVLNDLGIDTIDYLVCSHPHADHIGGFADVLSHCTVKQAYMNAHAYETGTYVNLMAALETAKVPVTRLWEGDTFQFGDKVTVEIRNPAKDYEFASETDTLNNASLLMKFTYGQSTFLTAGDLYSPQEKVLAEKLGDWLDADVCKINHHGYPTSSCKEWVNAVTAKIAVCECEGVPSALVQQRYSAAGAVTCYTAMDGTVAVHTTGDGTYQMQTEHFREQTNFGTYNGVNGYLEVK